jgi:hypothetical protein
MLKQHGFPGLNKKKKKIERSLRDSFREKTRRGSTSRSKALHPSFGWEIKQNPSTLDDASGWQISTRISGDPSLSSDFSRLLLFAKACD